MNNLTDHLLGVWTWEALDARHQVSTSSTKLHIDHKFAKKVSQKVSQKVAIIQARGVPGSYVNIQCNRFPEPK